MSERVQAGPTSSSSASSLPLRPRPTSSSGGFWTLLGWLRKDGANSLESLSSSSSALTTASFAFLSPKEYKQPASSTVLMPGPMTDSYKKRLEKRDQRRSYEKDLTLRRKYLLSVSEAESPETSTLPLSYKNGNISRNERNKRAISEVIQRRIVHVPGKRPAPQPPKALTEPFVRNTRKRPAPQPPTISKITPKEHKISVKGDTYEATKDNIAQSEATNLKKSFSMTYVEDKRTKHQDVKLVKSKQDVGFLRQLFESKKKPSVRIEKIQKILPNISELDKEASNLLECYRMNNTENIEILMKNNINVENDWICTQCLTKYKSSIVTCLNCVITKNRKEQPLPRETQECDKNKLKEMLIDMKHSLPASSKTEILSNRLVSNPSISGESPERDLINETQTLKLTSSENNRQKYQQTNKTHLNDASTSVSDTVSDKEEEKQKIENVNIINFVVNSEKDEDDRIKEKQLISNNFLEISDNKIIKELTSNIEKDRTIQRHMKTPLIFYNRRELVSKLEKAIAAGDEANAADAAVRMAQMRLNCSIISFTSNISVDLSALPQNSSKKITKENEPSKKNDSCLVKTDKIDETNQYKVKVWIEDKDATHGPIDINIQKDALLGDLCREAEQCFAIKTKIQRWIIGDALCSDMQVPLVELAGDKLDAPFYLCLVENDATELAESSLNKTERDNFLYKELIDLEQNAIVKNIESFECVICMEDCPIGEGIVLRECAHKFCRPCLEAVVIHCDEYVVSCPDTCCVATLQDREVRGVVTDDEYEKWLKRGLTAAEIAIPEAFHCKTKDCPAWALCEPGVLNFLCPVCGRTNCVQCECIHEGQTCADYKLNMNATNIELHETMTNEYIDILVSRGEALKCPDCSAIITKNWGCDWIRCPACKTEICWVTRGPRWGPAGHGDNTGGCKCGLNGKKCHPSCTYCH